MRPALTPLMCTSCHEVDLQFYDWGERFWHFPTAHWQVLSGACYVAVGATLPGGRASWRVPVFKPQEYMSATKLGLMKTFGHAPNKVKSSAQT